MILPENVFLAWEAHPRRGRGSATDDDHGMSYTEDESEHDVCTLCHTTHRSVERLLVESRHVPLLLIP